jgi:5-formaminoimidazole-4-carboxamide-1-beta-D-ribofuranosyl 5'-monophosphate synthetase
MQAERKKLIRYALDFDIENINTFAGYRGDLIVKITTKDIHTVAEIQKFANSLDLKEIAIKENSSVKVYEIFCVTPDAEVYHTKTEEVLNDIHAEHPVKDIWNGSK